MGEERGGGCLGAGAGRLAVVWGGGCGGGAVGGGGDWVVLRLPILGRFVDLD